MLLKKTNQLKNRHELPMLIALAYELYIRLYRNFPILRSLLHLHVKSKQPQNLFFIIGAYNAGTTIVKRAVAAHPSVASLPIEGDLLTSELSNMEEGGWHRCLYGNKKEIIEYRNTLEINAEQLLKDWFPWIREDKFFLEKSIANSIRVKHLRKAFPGCKFINVVRSPDGVINGIKKRSQPTDKAREKLNANSYPDSLLYCQWSYIYGLIKKDSKPEDTFDCSYENFIANPKSSIESLFDFLGLDPIPVEFESNILKIGSKSLFIRPSQGNKAFVDYSDPVILENEIKRLNCDE